MGVLDIIFPKNCLECSKAGKYMCESCLLEVPASTIKYYKIGDLASLKSVWEYKGVIRKAILRLKYNFAFDISKELSELVVKDLNKSKYQTKNCILVPIPLHKRRENWRGFNQAEVLGRLISTGLGWEIEQNLLTRNLASKQQVGLAKNERLRNIRGKYAVNIEIVPKLSNKTIVLFDDVWTTGATMKEAARTLKNAGFKNIHGLTICG